MARPRVLDKKVLDLLQDGAKTVYELGTLLNSNPAKNPFTSVRLACKRMTEEGTIICLWAPNQRANGDKRKIYLLKNN